VLCLAVLHYTVHVAALFLYWFIEQINDDDDDDDDET